MITAVIFDMNGVITDDEDIHEKATLETFKEIGIVLTPEHYRTYCLGVPDIFAFNKILNEFQKENQNTNDLIAVKTIKYKNLLKRSLKVYPGVVKLINRLNRDYKLALTSSSTADEVDFVLDQLKLKDLFDVVVTSDDIKHGKPHPEPYLLTADLLKVRNEDCMVIEDSENGIYSAKQAGMICIAIPNTEERKNLIKADRIINDYTDITLDFISQF